MFHNYLVIAWRSLLRNRLFSFINVIGLALSMSVCMIVMIRIIDSLQYDNFHTDGDRIYRVVSQIENEQGNKWLLASTPFPLEEKLSKDSLLLEDIANLYPAINEEASDGLKEFRIRGAFTQSTFFKIFSFEFKYGNPATALAEPYTIILNEATAQKFYGDINPIGKVITLANIGTFQITGILKTTKHKSHIAYDAYVSSASIPSLQIKGKLSQKFDQWNDVESSYTYVKLRETVSEELFVNALRNLSAELNTKDQKGSLQLELQALSSITPGPSDIYHEIGRGPSRGMLLAEVGIVLLILFAASFNYTNLSVARALTRGKEVGIRKLSGAQRWQIFAQYIAESTLVALVALVIANVLVAFILEYKPFNDGYEMIPAVSLNLQLLSIFLCFSIFVGVLAGAMPAWILSSFKPTQVLRNIGTQKFMGNLSLRKALIVFQFALSLVIIIFLSAFYNQFKFTASATLGFNRDHVVVIPLTGNKEVVASACQDISGVKRIGFTSDPFGTAITGSLNGSTQLHDTDPVKVEYYYCDDELVNIMRLSFVAGNNFTRSTNAEHGILLNEKAVLALGFKSAEAAIGEWIYIQDSVRVTVRGVVKDFYPKGYGNVIRPLALRYDSSRVKYMVLEVESSAHSSIMPRIEKTWKEINRGSAFTYYWLGEELDERNNQSAQIALLGFLGFMTVTIAAMGLLGLVVYTVETSRKEIGIRKIVGASVFQLVAVLSKDYIKLLVISSVIALPLGFVAAQFFLMNFVNRVSFGVINLAMCFGLLFFIGLLTILPQTYKASLENPAKNLKSE